MLGIIEKRKTDYRSAEILFQRVLTRLAAGAKFITDTEEGLLHYEIGMMRDGQKQYKESLPAFKRAVALAKTDSYVESDSSFEVARISLRIWLENRGTNEFEHLMNSIKGFEDWLARSWSKVTSKMWGRYHVACAYKEQRAHLTRIGTSPSSSLEERQKFHENLFSLEARSLTGHRKYNLRFVVFLMTAKDIEHLPGDPIPCELNHLLDEFRVH